MNKLAFVHKKALNKLVKDNTFLWVSILSLIIQLLCYCIHVIQSWKTMQWPKGQTMIYKTLHRKLETWVSEENHWPAVTHLLFDRPSMMNPTKNQCRKYGNNLLRNWIISLLVHDHETIDSSKCFVPIWNPWFCCYGSLDME